MTYPVPTWADGSGGATPVSAANLNLGSVAVRGLDVRSTVLEDYGSVRASDYGATGDDVADDTTALQNALNAVPVDGTLHLAPNNIYKITSALTWPTNVQIDGHGSHIHQTTANANALTSTDGVNLGLHDITIRGPVAGVPSGTGKGVLLQRSVRANIWRVSMQRVIVHSFGSHGIEMSNPITSSFDTVECRANNGHGWYIHGVPGAGGSAGTSCSFQGCYGNGNLKAGFRIESMAYCNFPGCAVDSCGIGYEVLTSQAISFSGCGAESQVDNHVAAAGYSGYSWTLDTAVGITLNGCWTFDQPAIALWVKNTSAAVVAIGFTENSPHAGATACIKTDSGTSTTIIHVSNTTANSLAGTDLVVHDGGGLSIPGYGFFGGALIAGASFVGPVVALTDAATIATNAALGNYFRVTLAGNRTLGAPTNPTNGQACVWEFIQDATGTRTLALNAVFALGTTITSTTLTTTAAKRDFLFATYNSTAAKWYVTDFKKGY